MDLVHRDDLSNELLEDLSKQFPGMKIVCAGDAPEGSLPSVVQEMLDKFTKATEKTFCKGLCGDCGKKMPNWPEKAEDMTDDWEIHEGWTYFVDPKTKQPISWQCYECDLKDKEGE